VTVPTSGAASVTVLIPTYNRRRALEAVWPCYLTSPHVAAVVVVDDGSTDGTADAARALARDAPRPVRVVAHGRRRGQQAARMTAVAAAETPWVLFGEDDVWLEANYVDRLLETAVARDADAVAGRLLTLRVPGAFDPAAAVAAPGRYVDPAQFFDLSRLEADFAATTDAPIAAPFLHSIALIRRELFARVGFDGWYAGNGWREETDFYLSAGAAGARVLFDPGAACHHLRGPVSALGGQRIARWRVEYFAWRNTRHLVAKHWPYLRSRYGMRGSPLGWTARSSPAGSARRCGACSAPGSGRRSTSDPGRVSRRPRVAGRAAPARPSDGAVRRRRKARRRARGPRPATTRRGWGRRRRATRGRPARRWSRTRPRSRVRG
jgi:glycosyltransferase involved in cell wall biosynthesis